MTWCSHCSKNCQTARDFSTGSVCCAECGKVITQDIFSEESTFVKDAGGQGDAQCEARKWWEMKAILKEPLIKGDNKKVLHTALHIVASMKRDWMQTGRKPSGICAAALYVSTLTHGFTFSKSDIVKVVHICEATLTKRLIEFENTESGSLTIEEFNKNAEEYEKEIQSCKQSDVNSQMPGSMEVLCEHKGKAAQSGYGLCRSCYLEFCGGLGGTDPPAFQRAEMERLGKASADEMATESTFLSEPHQDINNSENEVSPVTEANKNVKEFEKGNLTEPQCASPASGKQDTIDDAFDKFESLKDMPTIIDETDTLSDIDDVEVNGYLNNEEESHYKKIIWEEMNKEYMQEQAAKEAAAAAARKLYSEASDDVRAAQELAAAAAAAVANSREKRRQKRALEAKNSGPAQTAAEATRQMLTKKKLSSKINYDVLEKLFDDNPAPDTKKSRNEDTGQKHSKEENKTDKLAKIDEEEEDMEENVNEQEMYDYNYNNEQEMYDYNYDDGDGFDDY